MTHATPEQSPRTPASGTIGDLWSRAVGAGRERPAFLVERAGAWSPVSWAEAGERVSALAAGFLALGVDKGDRVAILCRTRVEWTLADFALATIGAVVVPVYPTCSSAEIAFILRDSETTLLIAEDDEQLAKIRPLEGELPALRRVVGIDAPAAGGTLEDLAAAGRAWAESHPDGVDGAAARVGPEDLLTFLYTSGTTGDPKGCLLTQRNYVAMVDSAIRVPDLFRGDDTALLFLPLAHNFARLIQFTAAAVGYTLAFCPDVRSVADALATVRPTVFPSVPRVYEKVYTAVKGSVEESGAVKRRLAEWAFAVGARGGSGLRRRLADRLVLGKVRARMGGRLRFAVSGGAPLAREIAEFFHACGITILEGYGLTECTTAATMNPPGRPKFGTVGPALPGVELRLDDDGEILIRGATIFAGYYGNPEATAQVLTEDGWLRSGDIGTLDADGYLTITDRKKDIIVTAGGKNVAPQVIENALKMSPYVSNALVVGDQRPYLVALVTVDPDAAEALGGPESPAVREAIDRAVADVNAELGRVEQIKRFAILPRDFSPDEGEITATLKLRRRVCLERFRNEVESLYATAREVR